MRIAAGETHVWLAVPDELAHRGGLDRCRWMLGEVERDRAERFLFEPDRRSYLAAHLLTRAALSWCLPSVAPPDWRFTPGPHGRPEISHPQLPERLRVNLSHARGLVACVVTVGVDCGVDVEPVDRHTDVRALARRVLTAAEFAHLDATPEPERPAVFARYWTLKEAYVKALGLGLAFPLRRCEFAVGPTTIRLATPPDGPGGGSGRGDGWQFAQWISQQHLVALAVRSPEPTRLVRHGD